MRRGLLVVLLVIAALTLPASGALAATLPPEFTPSCPTENPSGGSYGGVRICSGSVPSFDGSKMDVDLTQPMHDGGGRHPLIVMLHGFGNDKHEWESTTDEGDGADKYHWNNRWLAKHGYYVLTYTARGFKDDGPSGDNQPPTPFDPDGSSSLPNGTLHLKSRDYEIRDTQWLAALVAATYGDVDRDRIAVTGGSYGGIESWLQASQATWTFPHEHSGGELPILNLQVAVAKYPSTDLAYALAPNGHGGGPGLNDLYESSQGHPDDDEGDGNPIGVPKESYVTGLFAVGETKGVFEEGTSTDTLPCTYGNCEGPINIHTWKGRTDAGDPTSPEDPIIRQIRRGMTEFRGAYYQNEGWSQQENGRKVAVFSIQGWTDDLFPAVESFRMFKYLKRLDPRWPVELALADVGHSRAQNKPETWHRLNNQAFQWLQSNINGSHEQRTTVSSEATVCSDEGGPARAVGTTPEGLANGTLSIHYPGGTTVSPLGVADPNGLATDAIAGPIVQPGEPCKRSPGPIPPGAGYSAYSPTLESTRTYVGIGTVTVPYTWAGAASAQLDARLFDVAPDGTELLMTRGTYRLENEPLAGVITLPLYGNHWRLRPGHRIRLDLTQVDNPTYRASNIPSSISFAQGVTLTLPTAEARP
jgi:dienelactone hydrolase